MNKNINNKERTEHFYIYGKHPVFIALKNNRRKFYRIYTSNVTELNRYIQDNKINVNNKIIEYKSNAELSKLFKENVNHQGYVASVSQNRTMTLNDFIKILQENEELPRLLILDQLTDPHNIGAIIRTALAFNVNYIITTNYNSPKDSSIILKSSAGFSEMINMIEVVNLNNTIQTLKDNGYFVVGLAGEATDDIKEIKDSRNLCLVVGSEGNGIRPLVKKNCDGLY